MFMSMPDCDLLTTTVSRTHRFNTMKSTQRDLHDHEVTDPDAH
jgi:hypothetical protein